MRRLTLPSHRYGDPVFDRDYLKWGFHEPDAQIHEAQSLLKLLPPDRPLRILDLACGTGVHASQFAKAGHSVTAIDISETFIAEARTIAARINLSINFIVSDIRNLPHDQAYDVITWIEKSFFDASIADSIFNSLAPTGLFITDARNPLHPRMIQRSSNYRTWREQSGIFYLESHDNDPATNLRTDLWIEIDPAKDLITEKILRGPQLSLDYQQKILSESHFHPISVLTLDTTSYHNTPTPYWLWLRAQKP